MNANLYPIAFVGARSVSSRPTSSLMSSLIGQPGAFCGYAVLGGVPAPKPVQVALPQALG